ncbi:hypothetical protein JHK84_029468 [Glycine max]|uniref:Transmembrane protein n=1 Tax=Glycine soja TaxID=3848 RepID=A0A445ISV9_GLYSO|nr:hypothetical protein JHK84_029468 [Glycine max]RZB89128.1 hypothetical protein D0Y65_028136 [Glycine soja]
MAGALAWQVKNINKKSNNFWFWGRSHGNSGLLPLVCVMFFFFLLFFFLLYYLYMLLPLSLPRIHRRTRVCLRSNKVLSITFTIRHKGFLFTVLIIANNACAIDNINGSK